MKRNGLCLTTSASCKEGFVAVTAITRSLDIHLKIQASGENVIAVLASIELPALWIAIEAVGVHNFDPSAYEVSHELLFAIVGAVDFRE